MAVGVTVRRRRRRGGIDAVIDAVQAPTPALTAVGRIVDNFVAARFSSKTDPWGVAWLPPTLRTVELQVERGQGGPWNPKRFVRVFESGKHLIVGIANSVARYRHYGAPGNRMFGKWPAPVVARPELPLRGNRVDLPPGLREQVMEAFREAIRRQVREGGGDD